MEKKEDRKDFSFPRLCIVGRIRKSGMIEKKFCLVETKNERIKNRVCINLQSYLY